jgi:hypothetical protein
MCDWLDAIKKALHSGVDPVWLIARIHLDSELMLEKAVKEGLVVVFEDDGKRGTLN